MKKFLTNKSLETFKFGEEFAKNLKSGDTVLLIGDLGTGKTTFVQGVAKGMGIRDRILSPTFVLVRVHSVNFKNISTLNHVDLYRIEKPLEIANLGIPELISNKSSITIIEWADRLLNFKPKNGYVVNFTHAGENKREISIAPMVIPIRNPARMKSVGKEL